jgi:TrmH family RNA methyltransferase
MAVTGTVISSRSNPRVKQLRAAFAGNDRLSGGLVAIEGEHLLQEAIRSKVRLQTIFLRENREAPPVFPPSVEVVRLSADVFSSVVETRSPQGIAALIQPHVYRLPEILQQQVPLLVITAQLQDPGNLGTIIRSAEAFGAAGVITTPGTVDPWNQKALRASVGSIFRVPVVYATSDEIASLPTTHNIRLFAAVREAHQSVFAANTVDLRQPCAIMIGNEGSGLAPEWLDLATERITIVYPGPVESLNAAIAASLLLYEASRQRSSPAVSVSETIPGPLRRRPTGATR